MPKWSAMSREEKLAICRQLPGQQAAVAKLTGTTSSAVGGFMSRNAKELGLNRKDPNLRERTFRPGRGSDYFSETHLIEKWEERKKAREAERQKAGTVYISKKTGRPGNRWTPEMKSDFAVMYRKGIALGTIAAKLGVGVNACKKQRIMLNLPPRRPLRGKNRLQMHLSLDPEEYLLLRDGAERRGSSMTDYVAFLIRRDAGRVLL